MVETDGTSQSWIATLREYIRRESSLLHTE